MALQITKYTHSGINLMLLIRGIQKNWQFVRPLDTNISGYFAETIRKKGMAHMLAKRVA